MRENFKLRKMKVGLVSVAITMLYIMTNGQAEASENKSTNTNQGINTVSETVQNSKESKTEEATKNFVKLDTVKPGDQKVTGTTLPHHLILLNVDKRSVDSVDNSELGIVTAGEDGRFEYNLKDRKIVHNQEIEVTSSNPDLGEDDEEEVEEKSSNQKEEVANKTVEEESNDVKTTYTTPRYEKAYKVPNQQLNKENEHHQVWIEPITVGSGIIKGHTSIKGKVALSINNKFVNLGLDGDDHLTEEQGKSRIDGIWKHIDDKGYFEFDFKRKPYENLKLIDGDTVSLTFLPNDEEEALKPNIFKTKVTSFDNINSSITKYDYAKVEKVKTLNNGYDDLEVDDIYGFEYKTEQGRGIPQNNSHSTKVIQGKTKFANAVVKVYSSIGEGQEFPDLQVNDKGEFSFDSFNAGYRLFNQEKLNFTVVDPVTGNILSKLVTKEIDVYETPEQKADREFDEKLENTPAYYKLYGDKIIGFDTNDRPLTWFYPLGEKKVERKAPKLEK
ncbi:FKLRK protein [Staphylococcus schweitzeri]|uniref:FKLRK protein n=1 Tax=Staphylococcus schweitzeri TaxID=1654388 RepID=UPI0005085059|nr:FKLRK protein [Staphylococcus schweitzeri]CDR51057.1 gram-positive signal peptide%2C ysirk family protein [Staphylococcus schweitzeri]